MSSKLYYKLGLEELDEPVEVPVEGTVQEVELELNQIHDEIRSDTQQVDQLQQDTETLTDAQEGLESALKRSTDRVALGFIQQTIRMVDKRWGFDYPMVGMESDADTIVASMESGIGTRIKDMGKAILEMLKKLWAKLKEWGDKLLQLLGLKKKKLDEVESKAEDLQKEIREVGAPSAIEIKVAAAPTSSSDNAPDTKPVHHRAADVKKLDLLVYNWKFPPSSMEFRKAISMMGNASTFLDNYNRVIERRMTEFKTRKLESNDELNAWAREIVNDFTSWGLTRNNGSLGNIAGADKSTYVWGEYLPGMNCIVADWPSNENGKYKTVLPRLRIAKTTHGDPVSVNVDAITWLSPDEVIVMTKVVKSTIETTTAYYSRATTNFVKNTKELQKILEELSLDNTASSLKHTFIKNILTSYTQYHAAFTASFSHLSASVVDAMGYYLDHCDHVWKTAVDKRRTVAASAQQISSDQEEIHQRAKELAAAHERTRGNISEFERRLKEANANR